MKTQKGFATILAIIIGLVIVGGGIYALEALNTDEVVEEATVEIKDEEVLDTGTIQKTNEITNPTDNNVTPIQKGYSIKLDEVTGEEIYFSSELRADRLDIDDFPDYVSVSEAGAFGSSDWFNDALVSPDSKWIAISISGAAHDFGWLYEVSTEKMIPIAFSYGGGVAIDKWESDTRLILDITTAKPSTAKKVIDINNLPEYPKEYVADDISLTVVSPNGGETFNNGEIVDIPIELNVSGLSAGDNLYITIIDDEEKIVSAFRVSKTSEISQIINTNIYKDNLKTQISAGKFRIKAQIGSSSGSGEVILSELGLFEVVSDTSDGSFTVIGRGTN